MKTDWSYSLPPADQSALQARGREKSGSQHPSCVRRNTSPVSGKIHELEHGDKEKGCSRRMNYYEEQKAALDLLFLWKRKMRGTRDTYSHLGHSSNG